MDMEKFLTSLFFCKAPLDGYGTSVLTAGPTEQLVSDGVTKQRRAGFELSFDGLNCFDSVVMH
jgi:hypothetical protein